ncbi:hypothetical protein ACQP60_04140 [Isoptericola variabilis]|uniref:hypothetical protein n=1 Tax=Isoptericola variabilis TaxID=139208 RepID=UPI003D1F9FDF
MKDTVTSWLRTVVPGAWAALVTVLLGWLGTHAPWAVELLDGLGVDLTSPAVVAFVVSAVLALWYVLWRWLEPRLPAWATRLVLGSNRPPSYAPTSAGGVPDITSLSADERSLVNDYRVLEGRGRDLLPDADTSGG